MTEERGTKPAARDYGCGLVAVVAGVMFLACGIGGALALVTGRFSVGVIVGVAFNVLFWYWIALGAWRRTTWSSPRGAAHGRR